MTASPLSYGPFISREQAKAQGSRYYYTGLCSKGHASPKHVKSGCVECANVLRRKNMQLVDQECKHCGRTFRSRRSAQYCSKECGTKGWRAENKSHIKQYAASYMAEKGSAVYKKAYQSRKKKRAEDPAYDQKRKEIHLRSNAAWRKANEKEMREWRREYENDRYCNDLQWKIKHNLRSRVGAALRAQQAGKHFSIDDATGCTAQELIAHLEKQFEPGMSWDNWASTGWHIDHVRPCASFDLTDPAQQRECFHYSNLQPLWAADNLAKSDRWQPAAA